MTTTIKTGDTVLHKPSGETWVVAYVRPETNDLAWCGWPSGLARLSDCELVESCTPDESKDLLAQMAAMPEPDHRREYARQEQA